MMLWSLIQVFKTHWIALRGRTYGKAVPWDSLRFFSNNLLAHYPWVLFHLKLLLLFCFVYPLHSQKMQYPGKLSSIGWGTHMFRAGYSLQLNFVLTTAMWAFYFLFFPWKITLRSVANMIWRRGLHGLFHFQQGDCELSFQLRCCF